MKFKELNTKLVKMQEHIRVIHAVAHYSLYDKKFGELECKFIKTLKPFLKNSKEEYPQLLETKVSKEILDAFNALYKQYKEVYSVSTASAYFDPKEGRIEPYILMKVNP